MRRQGHCSAKAVGASSRARAEEMEQKAFSSPQALGTNDRTLGSDYCTET